MAAEWKTIEASRHAKNTTNPIRVIVDQMKAPTKSTKPMISLSIGDPTTDGHLVPPAIAEKSLVAALQSHKANGYPPSVGYAASRQAIADYWRRSFAPSLAEPISPDAVILGSGASHVLLMAITGLCNPGDTLLLPEPCFSLYGTICDSYGIKVTYYRCVAERDWEVDLEDLKAKHAASTNVKAVLLNNPSNPCGSSFTRAHVEAILATCDALRLPVIADEIYAGQVFKGHTFTSVSDVTTDVPRIVIGGLAKNFIVPGWRMGWSITVDPKGLMKEVHSGMIALSTLLVGPNSLIQATLEDILNKTDEGYLESVRNEIEGTAVAAYELFKQCKGLKPTTPQGAMYLMIGIDSAVLPAFVNGIEFAKTLLEEENVQLLPGEIFRCPGYFRIVTAKPLAVVTEAVERIKEFCARHAV